MIRARWKAMNEVATVIGPTLPWLVAGVEIHSESLRYWRNPGKTYAGWWYTYSLKNMKVNGKDYPI